ncbi:MAG: ATP-dependent zinc metalloprotease FtsH [Chloroflexi bacterium]|nr:ATP-dependent zinc metalloprotease FtsH [Chloroflexota bacterium]
MKDGRWRNGFVWLLILAATGLLLFNTLPSMRSSGPRTEVTNISNIATLVKQGLVKQITLTANSLLVDRTDNDLKLLVHMSQNTSLKDVRDLLKDEGVGESQMPPIVVESGGWLDDLPSILFSLLPVILLFGVMLFFLRQAQGANSQAMSFGKSRAKLFMSNKPPVTFVDVAGEEEAKQELQEVVEFLKYPDKFTALGARIPKGVLLIGPPGVGKTLLARAVAGEAGVPFFSISGSEFVEMFVGVGASRVRDLFDQAKRNSPCIVFIDELDAVGRHRGAGLGGSHDEREQTLNQILVEMDGFDTNVNVIILAATNRPDILDPALLRPGRFDRQVILDRPDVAGRKAILEVHIKGKPLEADVNMEELARQTPGFSGADLANLVNEAAILAGRRNKKTIGRAELQEAVERVIAGPEKKSRVISEKEKQIVAYHEAGHALVMHLLPNTDPVHKISIVSRGLALGYTMPLPVEDRHLLSKAKFMDDLAGLMGGRVAEEIVFGDITTGAQNDLENATRIARQMVCEYGMSERLGPRTFGRREELVFLGREISEQRDYSEEVAQTIDQEVRQLIDTAHDKARRILTEHKGKLDQIAQRLIRDETIEGPTLNALFAEEPAALPAPQPTPAPVAA